MKKFVFIVLVSAFVSASTSAGPHGAGDDGGTAYWDRKGGYYAGQGGEFTIWGPDLLLSNSAYAGSTSGLTWGGVGGPESLQTFCLESSEYIYEPMDVWVSKDDAACTGYGSGSHAYKGGTDSGDDLDAETAYLYTQFATGVLSGYDYSDTGIGRDVSAGALQRLIWNIEGEGGGLNVGDSWLGITLIQDQVDLISSWRTAYNNSGWTGIGNVRVLQMTTTSSCGTQLKQDQLYLTPTPAAVLLGILGLGVAGWKLRKFA
jgi:hypothetical protein